MSSESDFEFESESNHISESEPLQESDSTSKEDKSQAEKLKFISDIKKLSSTKFITYEVDLSEINDLQEIKKIFLLLPKQKHIYICSISLPPNLRIIKEKAFQKCFFLDQIIFIKDKDDNNLLNFIGKNAFLDTKIQSIIIPNNIVEIKSNCFPITLKSIDFEKGAPSLEKVGDKLFYHCDLETFSMPLNIKSFIESKNVFLMCKNLKTIKFDEYVDKEKLNIINYEDDKINSFNKTNECLRTHDLAKSLLLSQTKIENLEIFVTNLNMFYFYNTPYLVNITIPKNDNGRYVKIDGCLYTKTMKKLIVAERNIKNVLINSKCKIITNYALSFESLEKVEFEKNSELEEISFFAFSNSNIKKLVLPESVKQIDYCAFYECKKLESIILPNTLKILDHFTFSWSNLFEITIPCKLLKISYRCFYKCLNLKKVIFQKNSQLNEIEDFAFSYTSIESISIPKNVSKIGLNCFAECKKLKTVIFNNKSKLRHFEWDPSTGNLINNEDNSNPKETRVFKNGLYYDNSEENLVDFDFSAEKVSISKETKVIQENALKFSNIKKIEFESNSQLNKIDTSAFECLHIQEISIPNTCTIIGNSVFCCCKLLKKVYIDSKSQLTTIGDHAFEGTSIEVITFPSTLATVGDYAFFECLNLTTVNNQSKKINFGVRSFSRSAIKTIKFPQAAMFHNSSFSECLKLHHLTFIDEPKIIVFEENSFAMSGLVDLNLNCRCHIQENAFAFCKSLKKVKITSKESTIHYSSFYNTDPDIILVKCNILEITKNELEIYKNALTETCNLFIDMHIYRNFVNRSEIEILHSMIKKEKKKILMLNKKPKDWFYLNNIYNHFLDFNKIRLKIYYSLTDKNSERFPQDYYSCEKYHILNGILKYINLIDNISLFENPDEELNQNEIKKNEILIVPNIVKKFDFQTTPHIKKIIWKPECIVDYLGPPGFFSYSNLVEILIPKLVDIIPPHLFEKCTFLQTVLFENESVLKEIGDFSFANTKIKSINIPKTVQIIHKSAFMNVISLEKVQFHGEIIEDEAFLGTGIKSFNVSNNTKSIGNYAFQYCHSLTSINIDLEKSTLSEIGSYAFAETSITKINIPSEISIIKEGTFNGCKSLKKVQISPKSKLEGINQYSFADNALLEKISIPNTINYLSYKSFINTPSLKFIMKQSSKNFIVMNDYSVYSPKRELIFVPRNLNKYKVIPKCKIIHCGAFCGPNLKSVTFSDELLKEIENCAFAHSTGLEKITIPRSIIQIGEDAFIDCQNLEYVEFNPTSKLIEIPKFCFAFSGLKKIILPLSVSIINDSSFYFCQNLKEVNLYNIEIAYIGNNAFSNTNINFVKFPNTIKHIGNHAFSGNKSLKLVDFSDLGQIYLNNEINGIYKEFKNNDIYEEIKSKDIYKEIISKDIYKIIIKNSKSALEKNDHILEKLNICYSMKSKNIQIDIRSKENKIDLKNPINIKSSCLIHSEKTKTSAEIIKPVIDSKSKITTQKSYTHQITKPSINVLTKIPQKSPKTNPKIDDNDDQQSSLNNEETENHLEKQEYNEEEKNLTEEFWFEDSSSSENEENYWTFAFHTIFSNSSVQVFKFNLTEYRWYTFFEYCQDIKEYIVNPRLHLFLQKKNKENLIHKRILGLYYECKNINNDPIIIPFNCLYDLDYDNYFNSYPYNEYHKYYYYKFIDRHKYEFRHKYEYNYIDYLSKSVLDWLKMLTPFHFFDSSQITKITLDDNINIKVIPSNCFSFSSLKEIELPTSLKIISKGAFLECHTLKKVIIPDNCQLTKIHSFSFSGCQNLSSIHIPLKVSLIGKNCFSYSGLKIIEIPSSVCQICEYSFYHCSNLSNIILSEGILELGNSSFADNISLQEINLPNSLKTIKQNAFANCNKLTSVKTSINTQLIEIYNGAFEYTQIEELKINRSAKILFEPSNVSKLNKITFCKGEPINFIQLKDGTIYKIIKNINIFEENIFGKVYLLNSKDQHHMKEIIKNDNISQKCFINDLKFDEKISHIINMKKRIKDYFIHHTEKYDFFKSINSISLNSPELESDIENKIIEYLISKYKMFYLSPEKRGHRIYWAENYINYCKSLLLTKNRSIVTDISKRPILELVFAPKNLKCLKIHEDCFSIKNSILNDMKNLSNIEYMRGSTNLIQNFPNYNHLLTGESNQIKSIEISGNYVLMEEKTFSFFESLEVVEFNESCNIYFIPKFAFLECKNLTRINILSSCIIISEGAFKNCINLKAVKFLSNREQKLKYILDEAFYNCSSLKSIVIPSSVIVIKRGAFMNCSNLKSFEIDHINSDEEYLSIIEKNSFKNCISLESFNLPSSCSYLGPASFMNCINLKSFKYDGSNLSSINCRTFYNCKSLTKFKLTNLHYNNNSTTKIIVNSFDNLKEDYLNKNQFSIFDEAFMDCSSLKSVIIEDKSKLIDIISKDKFENNTKFINCFKSTSDIHIYNKVQQIQRNAFKNCKSLINVRFFMGNLEKIHEDAFQNCTSLKTIEINSIYWRLIYSKCFYMPNDINLQLFNKNKLIDKSFIISHKIKKQVSHSQKEYVKKESPFDWPISDNISSRPKLRSTYVEKYWYKYLYGYSYSYSPPSFGIRRIIYKKKRIKTKDYGYKYKRTSELKYGFFDNIDHIHTEYNYNINTPIRKLPPSYSKVFPSYK